MHDLAPRQLARTLADDSRLTIIALLDGHGPLCVCELVHALDAPQPRISQHLARLRAAGLVRHRRVANRHYYGLAPDLPGWATRIVEGYRLGLARDDAFHRAADRLLTMPDRPPRVLAA
ncbi:MAG: metalloregulator ArsR/SmtB family transcription factor [Pseudomonadota bacterium]